jgi:uncharacterized membrane protein
MLRSSDRRVATFFALVLASGACCAMLAARMVETGTPYYRFLTWNLFLAWIPFLLALALYDGHRKGRGRAGQLAIGALWLLFLPNAPYIATDFIHVGNVGGMPVWFDAALVASFAGVGLLLGLGSLLLVQTVVSRTFGALWGWAMLLPTLTLCSGGIVLGRIYRFNSWDAASQPGSILRVIGERLADPTGSVYGLALLAVLTGALGVAYLVLYALAGLAAEPDR